MVFLKDTCCDYELIRERLKAVEGTPLKIFNANAQSWYDSYCHGSAGYNGVMANFHPDLYKWAYDHKDSDPEKAQLVAHFLTTAAMIEMRAYPVSAKYHQNLVGRPHVAGDPQRRRSQTGQECPRRGGEPHRHGELRPKAAGHPVKMCIRS